MPQFSHVQTQAASDGVYVNPDAVDTIEAAPQQGYVIVTLRSGRSLTVKGTVDSVKAQLSSGGDLTE
ncbi:MAG TPA: hypothetical protein VLO10_04635 [Candidatus Deferrimicrobium sp.]|nr:hypothetical protein [Candidatus Deferrimicrobium sp.]